ncbi:MAG: Transcriptional regulator, HxlR family, partial [uncultured Quadrisphaera sp.]
DDSAGSDTGDDGRAPLGPLRPGLPVPRAARPHRRQVDRAGARGAGRRGAAALLRAAPPGRRREREDAHPDAARPRARRPRGAHGARRGAAPGGVR